MNQQQIDEITLLAAFVALLLFASMSSGEQAEKPSEEFVEYVYVTGNENIVQGSYDVEYHHGIPYVKDK